MTGWVHLLYRVVGLLLVGPVVARVYLVGIRRLSVRMGAGVLRVMSYVGAGGAWLACLGLWPLWLSLLLLHSFVYHCYLPYRWWHQGRQALVEQSYEAKADQRIGDRQADIARLHRQIGIEES
jgi:hypothetical protein